MAVEWPLPVVQEVVARALREDLASGDLTTEAVVPPDARAEGVLLAKGEGVVAGLVVLEVALRAVDSEARVRPIASDGQPVRPGQVLARVEGRARSLLAAERTALNLLQRLSGVATLTHRYVEAVAGTRTRIADTRKTLPGLRGLERVAVRAGGGVNHRFHLGSGVLIKDNHVRLAGGLAPAVARARAVAGPQTRVEVEVQDVSQLAEALAAGPDLILLDNVDDRVVEEAVAKAGGRIPLEVSGNVDPGRARRLALLGVDFISVGALTHSAPALDVSLELYPCGNGP